MLTPGKPIQKELGQGIQANSCFVSQFEEKRPQKDVRHSTLTNLLSTLTDLRMSKIDVFQHGMGLWVVVRKKAFINPLHINP